MESNDTDNLTEEINCNDFLHPNHPLGNPYFQSTVYTMYALIFLVAFIGNGFVCYLVISSPRMRTVTNYFIMNLAIGDMLITILCVPFTSVSLMKQYWPFGSFLCPVVNYSQALSVFVSAYTLVAISIDKYMVIMWPLKPRISKSFATSIIGLVWLIAGTTVLPTGTFAIVFQPNGTIYEVCDKYICKEDYSDVGLEYGILYSQILMVMQYIIPSIVLLFTYTSIATVIWCHRIPGEAENSRDKRIAKSKRKMVKMMVVVVLVYSICWLPYNILMIFKDSINEAVMMYLYFPLHGLAMSHACYNPIIYCFMNTRFRDGLFLILRTFSVFRKCIDGNTNTPFIHTGMEGTDSTILQRNNTCTTYISLKRKTVSHRTSAGGSQQLPARTVSVSIPEYLLPCRMVTDEATPTSGMNKSKVECVLINVLYLFLYLLHHQC